ncbi:uncharacterized protein [Struthio camelus]|uniref:uncharacterized protein isoform X4 n=1 Tax=Struthio camelus TaxID=8801 RepID=UPI003603BF99
MSPVGFCRLYEREQLARTAVGGSGLRGRRGRAALGRQPAPKHLCRRRQRQRRGCSILEAGAGGSACSPGRRQPGEAFGVLGRRAATHRDARKDWRGGRGPAGDKRMGAGLKEERIDPRRNKIKKSICVRSLLLTHTAAKLYLENELDAANADAANP